jgi:hypothetical protein
MARLSLVNCTLGIERNWTKREETTWGSRGIGQREKGSKLMWKKEKTIEELETKLIRDRRGV